MTLKRVVVTGLGALTPIGNTIPEYWEGLKAGKKLKGPAVISEYSATTFVPQGLTFQADKAANLLVEVV